MNMELSFLVDGEVYKARQLDRIFPEKRLLCCRPPWQRRRPTRRRRGRRWSPSHCSRRIRALSWQVWLRIIRKQKWGKLSSNYQQRYSAERQQLGCRARGSEISVPEPHLPQRWQSQSQKLSAPAGQGRPGEDWRSGQDSVLNCSHGQSCSQSALYPEATDGNRVQQSHGWLTYNSRTVLFVWEN